MTFWNDPSALFPKQQHRWVITFGDPTTPSGKLGGYEPTGSIIPPHFIKSVDRPNFEIGSIQAKYLYAHTFNFPKRLVWKPITISFNDVYDRQLEPYYADESLSVDIANSSIIEFKDQAWFTKASKEATQGNINQKIPQEKHARSTQLIFYKFLQQFGYFEPNELESEAEYLLRFRSYHFKRNMTKTLSGQDVDILNNNFSGKFEDHKEDYYKDYFCILELDEDGYTIEKWKVYNPILTDLKTDKLDYSNSNIMSITCTIAYDWAELQPGDPQNNKNESKRRKYIEEEKRKQQIQETSNNVYDQYRIELEEKLIDEQNFPETQKIAQEMQNRNKYIQTIISQGDVYDRARFDRVPSSQYTTQELENMAARTSVPKEQPVSKLSIEDPFAASIIKRK